MKVSVIIPCYPPHIYKLTECFKNILNQTVLPREVILAISQASEPLKNIIMLQYKTLFDRKKVDFRVHNCIEKQFAGQNRNRGAKIASGDIFMFVDADDQISKYKIELTLKYMTLHDADMLMHTFAYLKPEDEYHKMFDKPLEEVTKDLVVYDVPTIKKIVFGNPPQRNRAKELKSIKRLCSGFPPGITMGYATIKRIVFDSIKYSDRPRGEDTLFFKDCVWANFKVIMIACKLINYKPSNSFQPRPLATLQNATLQTPRPSAVPQTSSSAVLQTKTIVNK